MSSLEDQMASFRLKLWLTVVTSMVIKSNLGWKMMAGLSLPDATEHEARDLKSLVDQVVHLAAAKGDAALTELYAQEAEEVVRDLESHLRMVVASLQPK